MDCFSFAPARVLAALVLLAVCCGIADAQPATNPADAAYAAAARLQKNESYAAAIDAWQKFLKSFPADPRADQAYYALGTCCLRHKKLDQAAAAFQTVIDKYPKSEVLELSYLWLAITQYRLGQSGAAAQYDAALATLEKLAVRFPQGKNLADADFYRAECLYLKDERRKAAQVYGQFLARYPTHRFVADALYGLGVCQEDLGETEAAAKTYDDFLARFPENRLATEVGMRRGLTLVAQGAYAEAVPWLARAAAKPGFASADYALLCQADALLRMKQYTEAAALFASLPAKFSSSAHADRARVLAGKCLHLAGQYGEAQKLLNPLVAARGPLAAEAAHWLALSLMKQGKPAEAAALATRVQAQSKSSSDAAQLALDAADALYEDPARRKEAVARYADVAAKYPKEAVAPQALYLAGFVALEQADYPTAWKHANAFRTAYPKHDLTVDVLRVAAESALQLGKLSEAGDLYAQLLRDYPRHGDVELWQVRRLVVLQMQKKHQEMVSAAERLLAGLRTTDARVEACYLLGVSQVELKQYAAAIKSLTAALAADAHWRQAGETWLLLAHAYRQRNDLTNARTSLVKMIAQLPGSPRLDQAHARLGEYSYAAGDYRAAAKAYQVLLTRWPQSPLAPQALHELGCAQLNLQDAQTAEQTLSRLLEKYPQHALASPARYARAMARHQLQKLAPAVEDLQAVLAGPAQGAGKSDARYLLGLCYMGLKQYAKAAAALEALLKEAPQYAAADNAQYQLAWALQLDGKQAAAAQAFARFAADFPKSPLAPEANEHVADFAYDNKDYAAAAAAYYAVAEKSTGTERGERAIFRLGWSYYHQADYARAAETFDFQLRNHARGPLAQDAAFMYAESLFKQAKYSEALGAYARVRQPSSQDSLVLSALHAAQAAAHLKEWQKSLDLLVAAQKQFADSPLLPEILYEQGRAQRGLGHVDQSVAAYQAAIARSQGEAAARSQLAIGYIQQEQKQYDKAAESFVKVTYGYSFPKLQSRAAYEAARCYESAGKKDQAAELYRLLVERFPQSEQAPQAKKAMGSK